MGAGVAGCGSEAPESTATEPIEVAEGDQAVEIVEFLYEPEAMTVASGTTITWSNQDKAPHTATARDESFDTGTLKRGDSAEVTLDQPGTYDYYCRFHQFMNATITVE